MADHEVPNGAVEVIPDRLYWTPMHGMPKPSSLVHYFSIDRELVYEPFRADFGPLNLNMVYRYCKILESKLQDPNLKAKRIVHFCSQDPKKRANAAFLICTFQLIALHKSAENSWAPFLSVYPPFLPFRDASAGVCTYHCTILDCLCGLEESMKLGWFDWTRFDVDSSEFFERVENGDMNWVVPDRFLAFAGPCPTSIDVDGYPAFTPEDYVPIFRDAGINLVVRLNRKQYERNRFTDHGIKHVDLYFVDGSCPSKDIISKFLHITESEPKAMAIHCKAGLGRTGTLIGLYAMKHYRFPARAFIAWNRVCRPGSILGPQQQFLCEMQNEMLQAGMALRGPGPTLQSQEDVALQQHFVRMSLNSSADTRSLAEKKEDVGQAERLLQAKRQGTASLTGTTGKGTGIAMSSIRRGLQSVFPR